MRRNKVLEALENEQLKGGLPDFSPGDTLVVQVKVREGSRERLQAFEGVVIGKRNRGLNSAFTVRKMSHGVGVERTFQTHSPMIDAVVVEVPNPGHPFGVRGTGEVSLVPPLAAVANAVCRATGKRLTDLPMTPGRILEAIGY